MSPSSLSDTLIAARYETNAIEIASQTRPAPGRGNIYVQMGQHDPPGKSSHPSRDMIETFADTVTDTINLTDTQLF